MRARCCGTKLFLAVLSALSAGEVTRDYNFYAKWLSPTCCAAFPVRVLRILWLNLLCVLLHGQMRHPRLRTLSHTMARPTWQHSFLPEGAIWVWLQAAGHAGRGGHESKFPGLRKQTRQSYFLKVLGDHPGFLNALSNSAMPTSVLP